MTASLTITSATALTPEQESAALELVDEAAEVDGFRALNEAAVLHLRHPRAGVVHFLAWDNTELSGYGQLEYARAGGADPLSTGQLLVATKRRGAGIGSALLADMMAAAPTRLSIWAMGDSEGARALATRHGLTPARVLLILTRSLATPLPKAALPAGTELRTFVVGQDEDEWLRLNARAFASHPEQGQLTRADLDERMAESWFDPTGFFLAVRSGGLIGFHWTKQHPDRLGEVYVLGVDPSAGGGGLGRALLGRGLRHLHARGNTRVQLYVEADHERAVALYTGYGFTESSRDVMYAQP